MSKVKNILWGVIILVIGIIWALNALEITNITIFFEGWWTFLIIIPSLISVLIIKGIILFTVPSPPIAITVSNFVISVSVSSPIFILLKQMLFLNKNFMTDFLYRRAFFRPAFGLFTTKTFFIF